MANMLIIKRRIGSVRNTRQITKAMELVSASKMRRAQEQAIVVRPYREFAYELLAKLSQLPEANQHALYEKRRIKNRLYVVITSNSSLAGAYNINVLRLLSQSVADDYAQNIKSSVVMIGKKGAKFARHHQNIDLIAVYGEFGKHPTEEDIKPMLFTILDKYRTKEVDNIQIIYTLFKSNIAQIATKTELLPAKLENNSSTPINYFTNFEPSVDVVLDNVTARLIEVQIWQALLESIASEHSMRMLAMKNASDNAGDIIDDLTLALNTARQSRITQELAEITGGAEALKD